MSLEDQNTDRKSLRSIVGRTADWEALARTCVCFANGSGGRLLIGVDDDETLPPAGQVVPPDLLDRMRKRIGELTVNVQALLRPEPVEGRLEMGRSKLMVRQAHHERGPFLLRETFLQSTMAEKEVTLV